METNFPRRLLDAHKENKLMVIMLRVKVKIQMTVFLQINLKCRHLLLSQIKQITRKKNKGCKKKGNDTNDRLLPQDNSGEEADEKPFSATNSAACNTSREIDWEVSDFLSKDYSCGEWLPCRLLSYIFVFTLTKMNFVTNKMTFIINKDGLFERDVFLSPMRLTRIITRVGKASTN